MWSSTESSLNFHDTVHLSKNKCLVLAQALFFSVNLLECSPFSFEMCMSLSARFLLASTMVQQEQVYGVTAWGLEIQHPHQLHLWSFTLDYICSWSCGPLVAEMPQGCLIYRHLPAWLHQEEIQPAHQTALQQLKHSKWEVLEESLWKPTSEINSNCCGTSVR